MRKRPWIVLLVPALALGWLLSSSAQVRTSVAAEPEIVFHRDLVFGTSDQSPLTLNLALPAVSPQTPGRLRPAVLVFHGGGWTQGKKERHDELIRFLAREGYVAATAQYRLAPKNPWPAQIEDAKCAVRWLRATAARWQIDPNQIAALGFSAGAHLSMLLGTMDPADGLEGDGGHAEQSSKVDAVVSFFGPTDLGKITKGAPTDELSPERLREEIAGRVLGVLLGPVFREDPSRASPLRYVSSGDAPMLLVQGTKDPLVPYGQATQMLDRMHEAGVPGSVVFWLGLGHGWDDPQLTDSVDLTLRFLDRRFRPGRRLSYRRALLGR
jgi:acetyl esterase/lipase